VFGVARCTDRGRSPHNFQDVAGNFYFSYDYEDFTMTSFLGRLIRRARPAHGAVAERSSLNTSQVLGWYARKAILPGVIGLLTYVRLGKETRIPIFIGRGVSIAYARQLHMGQYSVIGSRGTILALSISGIHVGKNVTIRENAWIQCSSHPANPGAGLWIGDGTYIGPSVTLGVGGAVRIGERCQFGAGVVIVSENHSSIDGTPSPTEVHRQGVVIGNDCWLGHRATILDGVTLGDRCVVGAGAVVTRSFPSGSKIAGIPAKEILSR
jgi:acetyltransferase-like isoleucine patch superfamily enzyme